MVIGQTAELLQPYGQQPMGAEAAILAAQQQAWQQAMAQQQAAAPYGGQIPYTNAATPPVFDRLPQGYTNWPTAPVTHQPLYPYGGESPIAPYTQMSENARRRRRGRRRSRAERLASKRRRGLLHGLGATGLELLDYDDYGASIEVLGDDLGAISPTAQKVAYGLAAVGLLAGAALLARQAARRRR